ncbi:MAG: outer membrane beta-barrel protein [Fibrobacteraceae bacterium]|nr:outer membrane beta-barrel protein [Fibrobacteraceae bacterium]
MRFSLWFPFLLVASAFATEKVYMSFYELTNIHSDYQFASAKIFQRYAEQDGRYEITIPAQVDSLVHQPSKDSVQQLAIAKGCSKYILGDMTRLGETVIITLSLYDTKTGEKVWTDAMKATGPDDLDPILERMAKNLGTKKEAANNATITSVTQKESAPLRQKRTNNSFGVGISGLLQTTDPGPLFLPGLEVFWLYDARNLLVQTEGSFNQATIDDDNDKEMVLLAFGISAYYPFSETDFTPYLGGGISYSSVEIGSDDDYDNDDEENKNGILFRVGGGLMLNRTSTVSIRLRLEYVIATYTVDKYLANGPQFTVEAGF